MSLEVPLSQQGRCAVHPDRLAGGTCFRCGGFMCADCATSVPGLEARLYCVACAARPDVNYLEALRLRYQGKRDEWAWVVGGAALLLCVATAACLARWGTDAARLLLLTLVLGPMGGAFFLGQRWARRALLPTLVMLTGLGAVASGALTPVERLVFFAGVIPALLTALRVQHDVRNQLFFRLPVPPGALNALWNQRFNNPMARHAARYGFSSLLMPLFAPIAVVCGAVALTRVDPRATPPIGRRGQAIAGLVLGVAGPLLWWFILLPLLSSRIHL